MEYIKRAPSPSNESDILILQTVETMLADIEQNGEERFGWDAHRLALYLSIMYHTTLGGGYVISEIDDRTERNHLQWLYISIEGMLQNLNWGGVRSGTLMLPKNSFDSL